MRNVPHAGAPRATQANALRHPRSRLAASSVHQQRRTNHWRDAGDGISDESESRSLRLLPRRCQFRHRRNHPAEYRLTIAVCDLPHSAGEIDFDASILGAHVAPTASSLLSGLVVNITKVQNGTAGSAPVVSFTVQNNSGNGYLVRPGSSRSPWPAHNRLRIHEFWKRRYDAGYVTESAPKQLAMVAATACIPSPTLSSAATARTQSGRSAAYRNVFAGTPQSQTIEYGAPNKVVYFSVDGSPVADRRT